MQFGKCSSRSGAGVLIAVASATARPRVDPKLQPLPGSRAAAAKLADGCRHVFLDVGSNRGVHVRFLFEPALFPHSNYVKKRVFARNFGEQYASDPAICAFVWLWGVGRVWGCEKGSPLLSHGQRPLYHAQPRQ